MSATVHSASETWMAGTPSTWTVNSRVRRCGGDDRVGAGDVAEQDGDGPGEVGDDEPARRQPGPYSSPRPSGLVAADPAQLQVPVQRVGVQRPDRDAASP